MKVFIQALLSSILVFGLAWSVGAQDNQSAEEWDDWEDEEVTDTGAEQSGSDTGESTEPATPPIAGANENETEEKTGYARGSGHGWYIAGNLGPFARKDSIAISSMDSDVPTNCDQHLAPQGAIMNGAGSQFWVPYGTPEYDSYCIRGLDQWDEVYDFSSTGGFTGFSVGYTSDKNWRVEGEYSTRWNGGVGGNNIALSESSDKHSEFLVLSEGFDNYRARGVFANAYYWGEIGNDVRPFVGGGVGGVRTDLNYTARWWRNSNPAILEAMGRIPEASNTVTFTDDNLVDWDLAGQVMVGADVKIAEDLWIGTKGRWHQILSDWNASSPYDLLRSHDSNLGIARDGSDMVEYTHNIEGPQRGYFDIMFELKWYPFGN